MFYLSKYIPTLTFVCFFYMILFPNFTFAETMPVSHFEDMALDNTITNLQKKQNRQNTTGKNTNTGVIVPHSEVESIFLDEAILYIDTNQQDTEKVKEDALLLTPIIQRNEAKKNTNSEPTAADAIIQIEIENKNNAQNEAILHIDDRKKETERRIQTEVKKETDKETEKEVDIKIEKNKATSLPPQPILQKTEKTEKVEKANSNTAAANAIMQIELEQKNKNNIQNEAILYIDARNKDTEIDIEKEIKKNTEIETTKKTGIDIENKIEEKKAIPLPLQLIEQELPIEEKMVNEQNDIESDKKSNIEENEVKNIPIDIDAKVSMDTTTDVDSSAKTGISTDLTVNIDIGANQDINIDSTRNSNQETDVDPNIDSNQETDVDSNINLNIDSNINKDVNAKAEVKAEEITPQNIARITESLKNIVNRMANSPVFTRSTVSPALLVDAIKNQTNNNSLDTHKLDKVLQDYIFNHTLLKMLPPLNYNCNLIAKTNIKTLPKAKRSKTTQYIIYIELYDKSNNLKGYWSEKTSTE